MVFHMKNPEIPHVHWKNPRFSIICPCEPYIFPGIFSEQNSPGPNACGVLSHGLRLRGLSLAGETLAEAIGLLEMLKSTISDQPRKPSRSSDSRWDGRNAIAPNRSILIPSFWPQNLSLGDGSGWDLTKIHMWFLQNLQMLSKPRQSIPNITYITLWLFNIAMV